MKCVIQLLSIAALGAMTLEAGVIDLLRGERPAPQLQRVAFVGAAVIKETQGQAERLTGGDQWTGVRSGDELQPGDVIRTRQGTVVLRMKESGSFIKVTPHTILRLVHFETGWDRGVLSGREESEGFSVRACRGEAHVRGNDGEWQRVAVNSVLAEGTVLRLGNGTVVDLFCTREQRAVRFHGQAETTLNAAVFPQRASTAVAALGR